MRQLINVFLTRFFTFSEHIKDSLAAKLLFTLTRCLNSCVSAVTHMGSSTKENYEILTSYTKIG